MSVPTRIGETPRGGRAGGPRRRSLGPAALCGAMLLALALPRLAAAAEVEFYAVADRKELGLEDTLTLTVTVSAEVNDNETEELRLPEAPDFQVISRSQSQQMSFAMGQGGPPSFRRVKVYTLLMTPRRAGNLVIRPGRLVVKGRTYETEAIKVKVSRDAPRPQAPRAQAPRAQPQNPFGLPQNPFGLPQNPFGLPGMEDSEDLLEQFFGSQRPASDSDLYVRNYLDKKKAYLGEQVTLSTYLFSRVDVSGVDGFKMPRLDGFWAEDIETPSQITGEPKTIDGQLYRVYLLRRRALFPLETGRLQIEPVEVDISTGLSMVFSGRKVHRASQPVSLEVLPLPEGAPAGFERFNVGQWRLTSEASPTTVQLGQPVTLKLTLEGSGNLRNVVIPRLPAVRGMKTYEPTVSDKMTTTRGRFGGRRVLEYLMMPEQTGELELPALNFAFFNPATRQYETASTEPVRLRIEAGQGGPTPPGGAVAQAPGGGPVNLIGGTDAVHPIRYKGQLARPRPALYRRGWFLPVAAAPFALWFLLATLGLVRSTFRSDPAATRKRGAGARARRRLKKAAHLSKGRHPDAFYAEVARALNEYLTEKLGAPVAGLTRPELAARLGGAGLGVEAFQRLAAVLDACDAGRFAPGASSPATMGRIHGEALAVMGELESARLTSGKEEGP